MINAKSLLDQFLGGNIGADWQNLGGEAKRRLNTMSGGQGFAGGAVTGGLLGLLIGNKKARKMAGNVAVYGGAAALGLLAYRAFRNWQEGQKPATAPVAQPADVANVEPRYLPSAEPAADGQPFELALVRAMIAAAKADGHIDAVEQGRLFAEIENMGMDAEAKGMVFDLLAKPVSLDDVAQTAQTEEQKAELYLASRLAIDPDHPAEKAYLEALAARLKLPPDLVAHLERQVQSALAQDSAAA